MREQGGQFNAAEAVSLLDWWVEAGVDTLIDDGPRNWLRDHIAPAAALQMRVAATATTTLNTLAALEAHLATADLPGAGSATRRIAATGAADSPLFVLADMPDPEDVTEGQLVAGAAGRLFDRMLAAIGLSRADVRLAALCPGCPAAGRIDVGALAPLGALAHTHLSLVRPRALLLIGDATARALLGMTCAEARGRKHDLNHDGGSVVAIATIHPRILLRQPLLKAESWKDLQMLAELLR